MFRLAALLGLVASTAIAEVDNCQPIEAAYKAATDHVMFQLKSPFSAQFPELGAEYVTVEELGDCLFSVSGYVDARNSLGRTVRQGFSLNIQHSDEDDTWVASGLTVTN